MKLCRILAAIAVALVLTACGHGFEGEYQTGSGNEWMQAMTQLVGAERIVIGKDYIESNGERRTYDEIFVRKSGSGRYLVFKQGEAEEVWEIVDERTLRRGGGLMNITLTRVD